MVSFTSTTATAIFAMVLFIGESQAALPFIVSKLTGGKRSLVEMRGETPILTRDIKSELAGCLNALKTLSPPPAVTKLSDNKVTIKGLPAICITELTKYKSNPANKSKIQGTITISGNSVTLDAKSNAALVDGLDGEQPVASKTGASSKPTQKPAQGGPKPKGNKQN